MAEIDKEKALVRLSGHCSKREICTSKAHELMWRWGVAKHEQDEIVDYLISNRFIDDERYARSFVQDKRAFSTWGRRKVEEALKVKKISSSIIELIIREEYKENDMDSLEVMLTDKAKSIKAKDKYDFRNKLIRFGLSRGYEYSEVSDIVERVSNIYF